MYPRVANQLCAEIAANFFGCGVGGASNLAHLCRIHKDLGFKKVAGLLDGDKTAEAARLKKDFPHFYFDCIPATDIRTKPARNATEKVAGLLDEKMMVKLEFVESLKSMLSSLSNRMNS